MEAPLFHLGSQLTTARQGAPKVLDHQFQPHQSCPVPICTGPVTQIPSIRRSLITLVSRLWPATMAYYNAPLPRSRSSRDHFAEPPSILRILAGLPTELFAIMQRLWDRNSNSYTSVSTNSSQLSKSWRGLRESNWNPRRLLCLPHFFVGLWLVLLLWGERWVFQDSIKACRWDNWERWVRNSFGGEVWMEILMNSGSPKDQLPTT